MKVGVIYCAWNAVEHVEASLVPWIAARANRLGGNDFTICAVSVPFEGFPQGAEDDTLHLLRQHHAPRHIDQLISGSSPMKETEARGEALRWLVDQGIEVVIQIDADEFYTAAEIERIFAFVASRPQIAWFRGSLKNYVFDDKTYLVEPFTPARIHRINVGGYQARGFWDDNNVSYYGTITRDIKRDLDFPSVTIPKNMAWVKHLTWGNDLRSKRKIDYQLNGRGWPTCSFDWDETRGLIWRAGQPIPETAHD